MNLEQLVAEVLHELPFVFAMISLMIYSLYVFWFERWRYNHIATLFVCYAVRLIVTSQPRPAPPPITGNVGLFPNTGNPLGDNNKVVTVDTTVPPSVHQTVDFYWREALWNY